MNLKLKSGRADDPASIYTASLRAFLEKAAPKTFSDRVGELQVRVVDR